MARAFTIITDSACDLPDEYYKEHEIDCVQLGLFYKLYIFFFSLYNCFSFFGKYIRIILPLFL